MKTKTDANNILIKQVKQWKKDQAIISLTIDEMTKVIKKSKHSVIEQKVDGQTGLMGYDAGKDPKFATLGGVLYWDLPICDEIKKILKAKKIHHARIVGEMAGYADGKIIPFNETESIIKNPKADKTKVHWFVYHIIELNDDKYSTTDFEQYTKTWPLLKKLFKGSKYVHPVIDYMDGPGALKKAWNKLVLKEKNEGIVIRTDDNKVYKCKPVFTYDLAMVAVGDKKGKNWPKGMIGMTLMAFMDKDHIFRTAGNVGTGWSQKERKEIFSWAQKNKVGEDKTYIWVKPKKIMEVQWERSTIKDMKAYKYSPGKGYEPVGMKTVGTIVKPRFIRWRTDKSANPNDLRLTQIPDWGKIKKMALHIACNFMQALAPTFETGIPKQDPDEKLRHDRFYYDTIADKTTQPLRYSLSDFMRAVALHSDLEKRM